MLDSANRSSDTSTEPFHNHILCTVRSTSYKRGNSGSEMSNHLPKDTQLASGKDSDQHLDSRAVLLMFPQEGGGSDSTSQNSAQPRLAFQCVMTWLPKKPCDKVSEGSWCDRVRTSPNDCKPAGLGRASKFMNWTLTYTYTSKLLKTFYFIWIFSNSYLNVNYFYISLF